MEQREVHDYLYRYFQASGARFLDTKPDRFEVQLNKSLDLELMNRPFYWHYLEKTGQKPQPMKMRMTTNMTDETPYGEKIHFGSPRLHQIFRSATKKGAVTRLYEDTPVKTNTPLYPWLGLNVRISYTCHRRRDDVRSFGIQLISGETIDRFMNVLSPISLKSTIPDHTFTMANLIRPLTAVNRIKHYLLKDIRSKPHLWADEASKRMKNDLTLLERFYESGETNDYHSEKEAIRHQYQPEIVFTFINGGLFYLKKESF